MNNEQKAVSNLIFSKKMNASIRRAMVGRLLLLLDQEQKNFAAWEERIKHRLNKTRQRDIIRRFQKNIQAYKIVIYRLTPTLERIEDEPSFVVSKKEDKPQRAITYQKQKALSYSKEVY